MTQRVKHSEEGAAPAAPTPVSRKRKGQTNTLKPRARNVAGRRVTAEELGWLESDPVRTA